ncbi:MAG: HAMP domain-containing histidine kinase [Candidatus Omnitrophica bacterium]|nr:HAMP domain-containing histidine kinase [Candidatus Omnitrophota bacterium]
MTPKLLFYISLNIVGTLVYFLASVVLIRVSTVEKSRRNIVYVSCILFALSLSMLYLKNMIWLYPLPESLFKIMFETVILIPGFVFFLASKELILLSSDNSNSVNARFNKLKDEFLTVASHELRTPLSIISGFAEILMREKLGTLNDEQKRRVRKILMQGQRLNRIVDELLDLSRIRSGKVSVRKEIFDIVPVLKACYEDHIVVCDQQQIRFEEMIPDVLPDVKGDLDRVTQVVVNLLNNSIKYTPAGGTVILEAKFDPKESVLKICVRDTGIGVDPSEHQLIFEEFYRSTDPVSRKHAGSGLGLAIVKQLVESQDGKISVFSEGLGKGSEFIFSLPVVASAPAI